MTHSYNANTATITFSMRPQFTFRIRAILNDGPYVNASRYRNDLKKSKRIQVELKRGHDQQSEISIFDGPAFVGSEINPKLIDHCRGFVGHKIMRPNELIDIRSKLGLSQGGLAERLEMSSENGERTIRRWEKGKPQIPGPARIAINCLLNHKH